MKKRSQCNTVDTNLKRSWWCLEHTAQAIYFGDSRLLLQCVTSNKQNSSSRFLVILKRTLQFKNDVIRIMDVSVFYHEVLSTMRSSRHYLVFILCLTDGKYAWTIGWTTTRLRQRYFLWESDAFASDSPPNFEKYEYLAYWEVRVFGILRSTSICTWITYFSPYASILTKGNI